MTSLAYRPAEPGDMKLVVYAWLGTYRHAYTAGLIPMPHYERVYTDAIKWVMARPGAETWVAYNPGIDPSTRADLHGWCCVEVLPRATPIVHYVHVKRGRRRMGLARSLLRAAGVDASKPFIYTSTTDSVAKFRDRIKHARFNPLAARFPPEDKKQNDKTIKVEHRRSGLGQA